MKHSVTTCESKCNLNYIYVYIKEFVQNSKFKSIPYSQFKRLHRIGNNDHTVERRSDEMSEFFSLGGFPDDAIKNSLRKASQSTQSEAINRREKYEQHRSSSNHEFL